MLKLAVCSVEDVDHLVNTYQKNAEVKKNIELKLDEINAKLEKGAGSIIRMDAGSKNDPFKRSLYYLDLYERLTDKNKELDVIILKLKVVQHLLAILHKTNPIGAKIAERRIKGVSFAEIGTPMCKSSKQVQRYWIRSIEKAIVISKMSNGQAEA